MGMASWLHGSVMIAFACAGCGPQITVADTDPGNDEGTAENDGDGDADGPGDDDDGTIEGGSCAGLAADGPTVGGGEVGPSGFPPPCSPRVDGGPVGAYTCCSDDPAAEAGALPSFQEKQIADGGTPYFAGANNALGRWGLCIKTSDIPAGSGLVEAAAAGCPIPCDPTWDERAVDTVCGAGRVCCQTQEIEASDCVVDPTTGLFRPVDGTDIGVRDESGAILTSWAPAEHATHQDPSGIACTEIAGGDVGSPAFIECISNLHVANRRGLCMALSPGQLCPLTAKPNACDRLNER